MHNYRAIPHNSIKKLPADLLFAHWFKVCCQEIEYDSIARNEEVIQDESALKVKMKEYADRWHKAKSIQELLVGYTVFVRQRKITKLSVARESSLYKVIAVKGRMISAQRSDVKKVTKNRWFFKLS